MNAKVADTTTRPRDEASTESAALDAWHAQARAYLDRLTALAARMQAEDADPALRTDAGAIEAFFSDTSRRHRAAVERDLFPSLLASGEPGRIDAVRRLQQDQGWIDENWIELAPKLRAIAEGNDWLDPAEFAHGVEVYHELCCGNIALEESLIQLGSTASQVGVGAGPGRAAA